MKTIGHTRTGDPVVLRKDAIAHVERFRSEIASNILAIRMAAEELRATVSYCDCGACADCCDRAWRLGQAQAFEAMATAFTALVGTRVS
jgi:transposase